MERIGEDPVKLGLVASLARPGGTRPASIFSSKSLSKRLGLLHELVPKAARIAVLVNPANAPTGETTLRAVPEATRAIGLQIQVLNASTSREIEAAFATLVRSDNLDCFVRPASTPVKYSRARSPPICRSCSRPNSSSSSPANCQDAWT